MSVRWCKMVNNLSAVDQAASDGFDSVQLTVGLLMNLSEPQFIRQKDHLLKSSLAFEVCAAPLPVDVRVTQKGFNLYIWTEYLKKAVQRLAELGCRKLAWSDGRARVLPWEGDVMSLKEQLLQFLFMLCEVAGHYNITVLVEPLGPRRTNFLNTVETASSPKATQLTFDLVAPRGRIVLFGLYPKAEFSPVAMLRKGLSVYGDVGQVTRQFLYALKLLGSDKINLLSLITRRFSFDEAPEAFEASRQGDMVKVIFKA